MRSSATDAPTYDAGYDPTTPTHRRFVSRLADLTPAAGTILDAACGTAPYAGAVLERGLGYVGVDQSAGMLTQAVIKWPDARFELIGLRRRPDAHEPRHRWHADGLAGGHRGPTSVARRAEQEVPAGTYAFVLQPIDEGRTRLVVRDNAA
jgi:SAM-dependent methyltransferase